jgi:hypothetical protein
MASDFEHRQIGVVFFLLILRLDLDIVEISNRVRIYRSYILFLINCLVRVRICGDYGEAFVEYRASSKIVAKQLNGVAIIPLQTGVFVYHNCLFNL